MWHWGEWRDPGGWQHNDADREQWDRQDDDAWGLWRAGQTGRGEHGAGDGWAADWGCERPRSGAWWTPKATPNPSRSRHEWLDHFIANPP